MVEDGALNDDKYPHSAVAGRASVIVSGDKHLLDLGDYQGIRIVSPRVFLGMVGDR
jgi:uncharacterized protein